MGGSTATYDSATVLRPSLSQIHTMSACVFNTSHTMPLSVCLCRGLSRLSVALGSLSADFLPS